MRPALTKDQLSEIQKRRIDDPDVIALLWEIKRLRATVLEADTFVRHLETGSTMRDQMRGFLRATLDKEPCVREFPKMPG
jgi:hypothetical protein